VCSSSLNHCILNFHALPQKQEENRSAGQAIRAASMKTMGSKASSSKKRQHADSSDSEQDEDEKPARKKSQRTNSMDLLLSQMGEHDAAFSSRFDALLAANLKRTENMENMFKGLIDLEARRLH
jgi:hypothetical protein